MITSVLESNLVQLSSLKTIQIIEKELLYNELSPETTLENTNREIA